MQYEGKKIVIIGGTSGIGLATAKLALEQGARVLVTGRTNATIDFQKELGENALAVKSDSSSPADIDKLAERVGAEFGTLDLLFVNAGISQFAPFMEMTEALMDDLFRINAKGAYFTAQKLAPLVVKGGAIVFTTSVANVKGFPGVSAYAASKAALRSMVRSLASELVSAGVRVNAVSPGAIDTGVLNKALPKDAADKMTAQFAETNPMKRIGRPDEVAKAVMFLGFEATYTTGAEIPIDGGATQF